MLTELRVENLGVIDALTVLLPTGMIALTGETGAGKTLIVEAVDLLLGGRADPTMVRPGAAEARVEGRFVTGDTELVLARVIPADGRSRAYVDGRLATVAALAEHGARLVDLHGQHAHQSLLAAAAQRGALDRFAGTDLSVLQAARAALAELDAALAALGGEPRARARELDLLRYQLDELDRAAIADPDEDLALAERESLLADAVAHRENGEAALGALTDDGGTADRLRSAIALLRQRAPFAAIATQLASALAELDDAADTLRHTVGTIEEDPEALESVRARRQLLVELRRKYGETLDEVMAEHCRIADRVDELESYETRAASLEAKRPGLLAAERSAAATVARTRRAAAVPLAEAVETHLHDLALPRARLAVEVLGEDPADEVRFQFSANAGEPLAPLAKVASGGELARAMLALRLVLTAGPETLVFDEVDAGIGGEAAVSVGQALAALGREHQVLVVTHLAQVAAAADHHLSVTKSERDGRTVSAVRAVEGDERVEELSRMLSGRASAAARQHARELLGR
jgi:DNA repair protein RecN (Recombination protein N)